LFAVTVPDTFAVVVVTLVVAFTVTVGALPTG